MTGRALVIVDIQDDYFPGGKWTLSGMENAADNAARVLAAAREAGDTVVHVRHEFESDDAPFFVPGSDGARINRRVRPEGTEPVITKSAVNAFQGTNLKSLLDESGVEDVVIVGAMSHMCIDGAARAAADFGYKVTVVHDACATRDLEFGGKTVAARDAHAAFMAALGFAYATTVSTDEFLKGPSAAA